MFRIAGTRLLQLVPTLVGMSLLIFALVRLLPGDVTTSLFSGDSGSSEESRAAVRTALGLDDPFLLQYWHFVTGIFTGDLGSSFLSGQPVTQILGRAVPITLELTVLATVFAVVVGIPLGVVSAVRRDTVTDMVVRIGGLIGLSVPNFWIAILALLLTSTLLQWVPQVTWIPIWDDPLGNLGQMAIPAFAVSLYLLAAVMRMTRASVLEVLQEDYVRTARAKGAPPLRVITRHAVRNAMIPVVTVIGTQVGNLMGGATIIEVIFGLPGVGNTLVQSTYNRDYPVVEVTAIFLAAVFIALNFVVDLLYGYLDPRIEQ
ncbi:ABC transporter permease [Pseudonocardia sp. GCM10023141]|uniref:ABC transporter permease n=1 Tax=Pseudonocardia sp. GCM10023141 TaxID=3252653 RepID=UPI0036134266